MSMFFNKVKHWRFLKMATHTFTPHPIFAALLKAGNELGGVQWQSESEMQRYFLSKLYYPHLSEIEQFSDTELRSWVSEVADELNKILSTEGFDIQLDELQNNEIGVVAILNLLIEWLERGAPVSIRNSNGVYPGVKIQQERIDGHDTFIPYYNSHYSHPIAMISAKNGDTVWMTVADKEIAGFELFKHIEQIRNNLFVYPEQTFVHFPMIDLDHQSDISWLIGLPHTGDGHITQAMQQTKFKMNERGAHLKSAVAIATLRGMIPRASEIIIDKPFYLWIERPNVKLPIICAYMDYDVWKDPKGLSM